MSRLWMNILKDRKDIQSRDILLESGGNFSVEELKEFGLGIEDPKTHGRPLLYVDVTVPVRLIPLGLSQAAEAHLKQTQDFITTFKALRAGYELYRNCVNKGFEAPFVLHQESWEWPEPADFGWENFDALKFMASATDLGGGTGNTPRVFEIEGSTVRSLDVVPGERSKLETASLRRQPDKDVKFKITKLRNVIFFASMAWQLFTNQLYANGLTYAIEDVKNGEADNNKVSDFVKFLFDDLRKPIKMPGVKYAKAGERPSSENITITSFS